MLLNYTPREERRMTLSDNIDYLPSEDNENIHLIIENNNFDSSEIHKIVKRVNDAGYKSLDLSGFSKPSDNPSVGIDIFKACIGGKLSNIAFSNGSLGKFILEGEYPTSVISAIKEAELKSIGFSNTNIEISDTTIKYLLLEMLTAGVDTLDLSSNIYLFKGIEKDYIEYYLKDFREAGVNSIDLSNTNLFSSFNGDLTRLYITGIIKAMNGIGYLDMSKNIIADLEGRSYFKYIFESITENNIQYINLTGTGLREQINMEDDSYRKEIIQMVQNLQSKCDI